MAAMDEYWIPLGAKYVPCKGGYFIWVTLPEGLTSEEVYNEGTKYGVWIMEGTSCMVPNDDSVGYNRFIRICIALEKEDKAIEGIKRLAKVFERLLKRES
jgi:2-aminoadipate transaminase